MEIIQWIRYVVNRKVGSLSAICETIQSFFPKG
jgi:hypothetical protein